MLQLTLCSPIMFCLVIEKSLNRAEANAKLGIQKPH